MNKTYTVAIEKDPETGELVLPFPQELLEELEWHPGDTLVWDARNDGSFVLSKKYGTT